MWEPCQARWRPGREGAPGHRGYREMGHRPLPICQAPITGRVSPSDPTTKPRPVQPPRIRGDDGLCYPWAFSQRCSELMPRTTLHVQGKHAAFQVPSEPSSGEHSPRVSLGLYRNSGMPAGITGAPQRTGFACMLNLLNEWKSEEHLESLIGAGTMVCIKRGISRKSCGVKQASRRRTNPV